MGFKRTESHDLFQTFKMNKYMKVFTSSVHSAQASRLQRLTENTKRPLHVHGERDRRGEEHVQFCSVWPSGGEIPRILVGMGLN